MDEFIVQELRGVLADWIAGKELRVLRLGHAVHLEPASRNDPARFERHTIDQRRTLKFVLEVISNALLDVRVPLTVNQFKLYSDLADQVGLSKFEIEAGESLAWKALLKGWAHSMRGFPDDCYVTIAGEKETSSQSAGHDDPAQPASDDQAPARAGHD
jgi:hypothetical protein